MVGFMVVYWQSCNMGVKDKGGTGGSWGKGVPGHGIGSLGRKDQGVPMTSVVHVLSGEGS